MAELSSQSSRGIESIDLLSDQLTCSICLDSFKDPRLLPCHHYFCKVCIENLAEKTRKSDHKQLLLCPECRAKCDIASVASLAPAFFINRLENAVENLKSLPASMQKATVTECGLCNRSNRRAASVCQTCKCFLCLSCQDAHEHMRMFMEHRVILLNSHDAVRQCEIHNESLKYYCKECDKVVCSDCIVQLHNGHEFSSVQLLGEDFKTKLQSKISYLDTLEKQVTSKLEDVSLVKEEVDESVCHFSSIVDSRFMDIHDLVDKMKEQIHSKLSCIFIRRSEDAAKQLEQLNTEITELALMRKTLEHTLSEASLTNLVSSYKNLTHQCDKIVDACGKSIKASNASFGGSKPCVEINLPSSKSLQDFFASNCDVYDMSAAPDNCTWSGIPPGGEPLGATIVEVGKEVCLGLMVRNHANQPCSSPQHFKIFLKHGMNEQVELPSSFSKGEYKFSFTPVKQGRSKIHIVLNHVPLSLSPICFTAHLPIDTIYHQPTNIIRMSQCPWGITCSPDNVLAVTQAMTVGSIVKITPDTTSSFPCIQSRISHSELSCPCGITTDDDGNLYVSDAGSNLVYKIDPSDNLVSCNGNHNLKDPLGLAVMDGRVYVCDSGHDCVAVFSSYNLSFLWKFGKSGDSLGSLSNPTDIATNETSKLVYVSDNGNSRIQAFSPDGLIVCSFGEAVLFKPAGLYFDQTRNIMFVTDTKLLCVFVFGCDGNYLTKFGETFISSSPSAITCDKDNYIYVCDHFDKCLYVF